MYSCYTEASWGVWSHVYKALALPCWDALLVRTVKPAQKTKTLIKNRPEYLKTPNFHFTEISGVYFSIVVIMKGRAASLGLGQSFNPDEIMNYVRFRATICFRCKMKCMYIYIYMGVHICHVALPALPSACTLYLHYHLHVPSTCTQVYKAHLQLLRNSAQLAAQLRQLLAVSVH